MSRTFEGIMTKLSEDSGYDYDFLVDMYNDMIDDGEDDWAYFVGVTMEHDW
jgi:hypothetical protein